MNFKQLREQQNTFPVEVKTGEGVVELNWSNVEYADGYRIFTSPVGKNHFIGEINVKEPRAVLKKRKNGLALSYKVKAFRIADGPDNFFGESEVVIACPMETPKKLTASVGKDGVCRLSWRYNAACDGFKIYADADGSGKYTFVRYCKDSACNLDNFNKSGNVSFCVRSFVMVEHEEKLSKASAPVTAVIPKAKTERTAIPNHSEIRKVPGSYDNARFCAGKGQLQNNNHKCTVMIGGDITASKEMQRAAVKGSLSFNDAFASLGGIFASSDYSVAVLDSDVNDKRPYAFEDESSRNCPSVIADAICSCGIDALAVNPSVVHGLPKSLEKYPLTVIANDKCVLKGTEFSIVDINNIKVGFISSTVNKDISADVKRLRDRGAEYVFMFCSWNERHTPVVKRRWRVRAEEAARSGVDMIVGCGLNAIAEYDVIECEDGRKVPVAYSIGSLVPDEAFTKFEDIGSILCVRLKRDTQSSKVLTDFVGYIPYAIKQNGADRRAVLLTDENIRYFGTATFESYKKKIAAVLGSKIGLARYENKGREHSFALMGSVLTADLFDGDETVVTDRSHLFISQLAVCGNHIDTDEKYYRDGVVPLYYNLTKGFDEYLAENKSENLILDLYYAASTPIYEMDGVLYSGGKAFVESRFYEEYKDRLKKLSIKDESVWKPLLDRFIASVTSVYSPKNIMLIRVGDPGLYLVNGRFIRARDRFCDFRLLQEMENYFIMRTAPVVIDISKYYPGVVNRRGRCFAVCRDKLFGSNISLIAKSVCEKSRGSYVNTSGYDNEIWLRSAAMYFDIIKQSRCDNFFFVKNNAADYFISRLSGDFIFAQFRDILSLKESNLQSFAEINARFDFGTNDTLRKVFNAVNAIRKGDASCVDIDEVIRLNLSAQDDLADMLAAYFDKTGVIPGCRLCRSDLKFYLKCARLLNGNVQKDAVVLLLQSFYEKNRPVSIATWGRADSSEILRHSQKTVFAGGISGYSALTAFEKAVDVDLSYTDSSTKIFKELTRSYLNELPDADFVMVDFADIITPLYRHKDTYAAKINGFEDTMVYRAFMSEDELLLPFESGIPEEYIDSAVGKLADYLKERYGDRIILRKTSVGVNRLDMTGRIRPLENTADTDAKNALIRKAEKLLEKLTGCYVLDYEKSYLTIGTDRNSDLSGRMIENDFYIESAKAVDRIVSGDEKNHQESVDITGYIERCERIKNDNPDMSAELSHDIFGGLSKMLLTE